MYLVGAKDSTDDGWVAKVGRWVVVVVVVDVVVVVVEGIGYVMATGVEYGW